MTDHQIPDSSLSHIRRVQEFLSHLPASVISRLNLDKTLPLQVKFGSDVENKFYLSGQNIISRKFIRSPLIETLDHELGNRGLTWKPGGAGYGSAPSVFEEGSCIEYLLRPGDPESFVKAFDQAKETVNDVAENAGLTVVTSNPHIHISAYQGDRNLMALKDLNFELLRTIVNGIHDYQSNLPAFFVRPRIAENQPEPVKIMRPCEIGPYKGARAFSFNRTDSRASIRAKYHTAGRYMTIESRLSPLPTAQTTALHLDAIRSGLVNGEDSAFTGEACRYKEMPIKEFMSEGQEATVRLSEGCPLIQRGEGGYLEMLSQTIESLNSYNPFTQGQTHEMLSHCFRAYSAYLDTPLAQTRYSQEQVENLRQQALEAVSSTPAPAVQPA